MQPLLGCRVVLRGFSGLSGSRLSRRGKKVFAVSLQSAQGIVAMEPTTESDEPGQPVRGRTDIRGGSHLEFLHRISERLAVADPLHEVLDQIVGFLNDVVGADSCFIYLLEGEELVLRASKNPHPESVDKLRIAVGEGITGWVAEKLEPVAISERAVLDHRFREFTPAPGRWLRGPSYRCRFWRAGA